MANLESDFLNSCLLKPHTWLRYIDDIFMIWTHGPLELQNFITKLNNFHDTIKFTHEISNHSIPFLDVQVTLNNNMLETDLYCKPTDKHQYLLYTSSHPQHCKNSLPYSLALRLRRICSNDTSFRLRLKELQDFLTSRGFPIALIKKQFSKVHNISRHSALKNNTKKQCKRVPFVTKFNPRLQGIEKIFKKNLPILHSSPNMKTLIPDPPITAWRKCKSLKDILVKSTLTQNTSCVNPGTFKCKIARCKMCNFILDKNTFTSSISKETFSCKQSTSCITNNVIYLITCNQCLVQYVGQTGHNIQTRFRNHRYNIVHKNHSDTIGHHFNTPHHSIQHMKVQIIEQLKTNSLQHRLSRENYWINTLKTLHPTGLNIREDLQQ